MRGVQAPQHLLPVRGRHGAHRAAPLARQREAEKREQLDLHHTGSGLDTPKAARKKNQRAQREAAAAMKRLAQGLPSVESEPECPGCAELREENARLTAEVDKLREQLDLLG
jgi:hypothetical protein